MTKITNKEIEEETKKYQEWSNLTSSISKEVRKQARENVKLLSQNIDYLIEKEKLRRYFQAFLSKHPKIVHSCRMVEEFREKEPRIYTYTNFSIFYGKGVACIEGVNNKSYVVYSDEEIEYLFTYAKRIKNLRNREFYSINHPTLD